MGNFPLWLAPVQMIILPIADRHEAYAREILSGLRAEGLRVKVDDSRRKNRQKIRQAEIEKIPLMAIVGDKEMNGNSLSLRIHGQGDQGEMKIDTLLPRLKQLIQDKSLEIKL